MIRNLIWDVDGTLFDTYPAMLGAFSGALDHYGFTVPAAELQALADISMKHCVETLAARFNLPLGELYRRYEELYGEISLSQQPPYPGVSEVCRYIREQGGQNTIVTHRRCGTTRALLEAHHLAGCFSDILSLEDGFPRKPDPAMYLESLRRNQLSPAETVGVGDRELDIQAARAAGLRTAFFRRAPLVVEADFSFSDYAELLAWLKEEQAG